MVCGETYLTIRSLIVCWNVARGILYFMGEAVNTCKAVVYSVIAFAATDCYAVQTLHLLLESLQSQFITSRRVQHQLPVTSCRKYRKKRSFESASVCVCEVACMIQEIKGNEITKINSAQRQCCKPGVRLGLQKCKPVVARHVTDVLQDGGAPSSEESATARRSSTGKINCIIMQSAMEQSSTAEPLLVRRQ